MDRWKAKCPGCGLVQFVETTGCRRCGGSLEGVATLASVPPGAGGSSLSPAATSAWPANPYAPPTAPDTGASPSPAPVGALAGRGTRLAAAILDGAAVVAPALLILPFADKAWGGILAGTAGLAVLGVLGYQIVGAMRGQTIGKRALGIRVDYQGGPPGFYRGVFLRGFVFGLAGAIPLLGGFIGLADVLCIFRENRRCLHDQVADTNVLVV